MRVRARKAVVVGASVVALMTVAACAGGRSASVRSQVVRVSSASSGQTRSIAAYVSFNGNLDRRARVVIVGGFADWGSTTLTNVKGKRDPSGDYLKFTLRHGTFLAEDKPGTITTNTITKQCTSVLITVDHYVLSHGTGQYSGITGVLRGTLTSAWVVPRYDSGPKKGNCNWGYGSLPRNSYETLVAHGPASVSAPPSN
jgi:hypothetical protein